MTAPPLDGFRVVDFTELLPGPFLTQSGDFALLRTALLSYIRQRRMMKG